MRNFTGLFFAPAGHRLNVFLRHRLSSFLLTQYGPHGCNAVGCANTNGHRPTNTRSSFSAPEAVLNEVEQRFVVGFNFVNIISVADHTEIKNNLPYQEHNDEKGFEKWV